jgi:hypothetical protein
MNTIQQTVTIPPNRRLQLDLALPQDIPTGEAEIVVVLSPTGAAKNKKSLLRFAGCLADSKTFMGDPVAAQKALRDEWQVRSDANVIICEAACGYSD